MIGYLGIIFPTSYNLFIDLCRNCNEICCHLFCFLMVSCSMSCYNLLCNEVTLNSDPLASTPKFWDYRLDNLGIEHS